MEVIIFSPCNLISTKKGVFRVHEQTTRQLSVQSGGKVCLLGIDHSDHRTMTEHNALCVRQLCIKTSQTPNISSSRGSLFSSTCSHVSWMVRRWRAWMTVWPGWRGWIPKGAYGARRWFWRCWGDTSNSQILRPRYCGADSTKRVNCPHGCCAYSPNGDFSISLSRLSRLSDFLCLWFCRQNWSRFLL